MEGPPIRLLPTTNDPKQAGDPVAYAVISGAQLFAAIKEQPAILAICVAEANSTPTLQCGDAQLTQLLEAFHELFPSELPVRLPPEQSVQHQIDLVLGSAIPNQPHY